jgi:polysaccharide export outer membrane protein
VAAHVAVPSGKDLLKLLLTAAGALRRAHISLVVVLIAGLLLSGCVTRGGPVAYDVQGFETPDAPEEVKLQDYKIEPLDSLKMTVFQVPDLSGDYEVDLKGNVALPLVGTVKAAGMTTEELQADLQQRLKKYMLNPVVNLAVSAKPSARRSITVDGAVRQPGMFPVTGSLTLIQAISMARGLEQDANPRRVAIFRRVGGRRMAAAFDLTSIRRGQADDPEIHSGDVIVVDGAKAKAIQRDLLQAIPILGIFRPF